MPRITDPRITEKRNPRSANIDLASPLEIVDLIAAEDARVPAAVHAQREQIARAIEVAEATFRRGGRLFYVGAGTSGRLGVLDASEMPPTYGTDPEMVQGIIAGGAAALTRAQEGAEDQLGVGARAMDEHGVGARDFVVGIAASGTTPYVRAALERAHELGARTAIVACSPPPAELVKLVDVAIVPIVGPEVVTGSTRLKAGTATKLVLNTLTTASMARLGKVYGNRMVDVQPRSRKLRERAARLVAEIGAVASPRARRLLAAAGGRVPVAIVMARRGVPAAVAARTLRETGSLRSAIDGGARGRRRRRSS